MALKDKIQQNIGAAVKAAETHGKETHAAQVSTTKKPSKAVQLVKLSDVERPVAIQGKVQPPKGVKFEQKTVYLYPWIARLLKNKVFCDTETTAFNNLLARGFFAVMEDCKKAGTAVSITDQMVQMPGGLEALVEMMAEGCTVMGVQMRERNEIPKELQLEQFQ